MPFLSIIVPMYNRERFVRRCLDSVLSQPFSDLEVIVVDDGSTDRSADIVREVGDPRVKLIEHPVNRGVLPARATGAAAARGEWFVYLDSDDELVPDVLEEVSTRLRAVDADIDAALFACRLDNGQLSPDPPIDTVIDYVGYIEMAERYFGREQEVLNCLRSRVGAEDLETETRGLEELLLLDFYQHHKARLFSLVARLYHQDAENQLVKRVTRDPGEDREFTLARIEVIETLLRQHGEALQRHAPRIYWQHTSRLAVMLFSVGDRRAGFRFSWIALRAQPTKIRSWVVPAAGLIGRSTLRNARVVARKLTERRAA